MDRRVGRVSGREIERLTSFRKKCLKVLTRVLHAARGGGDTRVGPITPDERKAVMQGSPVGVVYDQTIDRESAYEVLNKKAETRTAPGAVPTSGLPPVSSGGSPWGPPPADRPDPAPRRSAAPPHSSSRETVTEAVIKSVARNVTGQLTRSVTRELVRGILGGLSKGL